MNKQKAIGAQMLEWLHWKLLITLQKAHLLKFLHSNNRCYTRVFYAQVLKSRKQRDRFRYAQVLVYRFLVFELYSVRKLVTNLIDSNLLKQFKNRIIGNQTVTTEMTENWYKLAR